MLPDDSTRTIPLTQGRVTLVDADAYEMLMHWKWHFGARGYAVCNRLTLCGIWSVSQLHRVLLLPDPDQYVDHINGDRLDNRRANLRVCTNQENGRARHHSHGLSQYVGVSFDVRREKWRARISDGRTRRCIGSFQSENAAARAYDAAAREIFGEFAVLNFPD